MTITETLTTDLQVKPVTPRLGAVVSGVDLKSPLPQEVVDDISALVLKYKVLFFPGASLGNEEHERFMAHFGEGRIDPMENVVEGHPGLATIDNVPFFHADWMCQENPPRWSALQMNRVPDVGGDTMWADLVSSYQDLSESFKAFLRTLTVFQAHMFWQGDDTRLAQWYVQEKGRGEPADFLEHVRPSNHPLVRYIPETGAENYWICKTFTRQINELSAEESAAVLQYLFSHQVKPQYVVRWHWQPGDLAFWDHRTTLHTGVKDYDPDFKRFGRRASVAGGRPIPVPAP